MTVREIVRLDNPILRRKARRVTAFGPALQRLVGDMIATLDSAHGVGLAAPQIGVSQRLIVVHLPDGQMFYVIANPEIFRASRSKLIAQEGCLSIPGVVGNVERCEAVTVSGQDYNGARVRIRAEGWLARVFQHEIDHLDGRLFIDLLTTAGEIAS